MCPSTTGPSGLKYILPRHLVFRDALTSVLASHCLLCTGSSVFNLPRTLNPVAVAMLDVNDFSKDPPDPSKSQLLLECPSRQVQKKRDEEPVDVVVAMLTQELQLPSAAATPSRSGRASASASPESKMSTT